MKKYYIVSLYHTMKHHDYITLWRPNNASYCYYKEWAGVYETVDEGYHNSDRNMAVECSVLDEMFVPVTYDGQPKSMILNCKKNWDILGVKMTKDGLVRKTKYQNNV